MRIRQRQVKIRMTDFEYGAYKERLEHSKMNGNTFGLDCLLGHKINVIPYTAELLRVLKPIGNNLNQVARAGNSGQFTPPIVVSELQKGVDEFWLLLRQLKAGKV